MHGSDMKNDCNRMRAVQLYVTWIFSDSSVPEIAEKLKWAIMPKTISDHAIRIIDNITCSYRCSINTCLRIQKQLILNVRVLLTATTILSWSEL
jgi:hypothetical protein